MINTSNAYKNAIKDNRIMHNQVKITFADGDTKTAADMDLLQFSITDETSNSNSFDIGAAIAKQITVKINNTDGGLTAKNFSGAVLEAKTGLDVNGTVEWLDKGTFYAEPGKDTGDTVTVSAFDKMLLFDQPYTKSKLVYPATLREILQDACTCCDVSLATDTAIFDNSDWTVETRPDDSALTFRQVIQWIAQISCKYARINNNGQLTLKWYDTSLLELSISDMQDNDKVVKIDTMKSGSSIETDDVVVTGVRVIEESKTESSGDTEIIYQYGTDGYVLEITGNKLIQSGNGSKVAESIGKKLTGLRFRPLNVTCQSDPSTEAGDIGLVIDRKNNKYRTIITGVQYNGGGTQTITSGAESPERLSATRYSEATKLYKQFRNGLSKNKTEWEKAMEELQKAMESSAGLYPVIKENEDGSKVYYMCDHPTLKESEVVFELNGKGWAVSTDGGKNWNAGLLVDGTMITKILDSIGINADWINTGALVVKDTDGDILFRADIDNGQVYINATTLKITGKSVEEIAQDSAKKYVTSVVDDIAKDISTQYFGAYDPDLTNSPAKEWLDDEIKNKHINDLFYNTDTKKVFRFIKNEEIYIWEDFRDPEIQKALENAADAKDTADGKRRVFINTPVPPYDEGDMWVTSMEEGKGKVKICKIARENGVFVSTDWIFPGYVDSEDVQDAIEDYDNTLGQPEIFNKLTNNGKNKGIYIQDGELYVNASYILSGVLAGKLINGKGLNVTDKNGQVTLKIDDDGNVYIKATEFSLEGKNISDVVAEESDKFRTLNVILSNEYQGIPTDKDGNYTSFPSCATTVKVLYGTEDVTKTSIIQWTTSSGIYGSASGETYTVSGLSTDTGTIKVTVTRGSLTAEKIFTIAKQKQGIQGEQGQTGKTGATGNGISSITTYYLATASSSGVYTSSSGWTTSVQSPTSSKPYLWSYQTTYYTNGTSSNTSPHIIGIRGSDGEDPGELTQEQIFNILTNNGETQGIYLSNGKIYINGSYIKSKSITSGMLSVSDLYSIGAKIGGWTINSSYLQSIGGAIKLYSSGTIQVGNASIKSESNALVIRKGLKIYCGTDAVSDGTDRIQFFNLQHVTSGGHMVFASDGSSVAYLSSSSKRYKDHISDMTIEEAEKILDVPVVWFKYKKGYLDPADWLNDKKIPGFYAEDVYDIFPEATQLNETGEPEDWNFRVMIPAMMKVIQNQNEKINNLSQRLSKLEELISKQ